MKRTLTLLKTLLFKKYVIFESIGFDNLNDFLKTIFIQGKLSLLTIGITISTFIGVVRNFVDHYVYSPSWGIGLLALFTMVEGILGLSAVLCAKDKDGNSKFDPNKMVKTPFKLAFQIFVVFSVFQMNTVWPIYIHRWIADVILLSFTLASLWGGVTKAYKLRLISKAQYEFMVEVLNLGNVFKNFWQKVTKKNGEKNDKI